MMRSRINGTLSIAIAVILSSFVGPAVAPSGAGTIEPDFARQLQSIAPEEMASALVLLRETAPIRDLDRSLSARDATRSERHQLVVESLQSTATRTQEGLLRAVEEGLRSGAADRVTSYWIVNALVLRATPTFLARIAARDDVAVVMGNPHPELIAPIHREGGAVGGQDRGIGVAPGVRAVRADLVWRDFGITGRGRMVANMDTGVDGSHPALRARWRGNNGHPWQECWYDVLGHGTEYPEDTDQHGTHVMGTITGLGAETGDTVGVAWGAQWIAVNTIGTGGDDFDNEVLLSFQWLADPDGNPSTSDDVPDVVQNSWGIQHVVYPPCYDYWWEVIDNCEAAGCVVTFSAGNEGPDPQSLRSPPDRSSTPLNVFAIGAVDATNYEWPYPIAEFSSRGPTECPEGDIKPEVSAPGVDVYSSVPGGGYSQNFSGTSMAGPHVAGIVALMREANPDLEVNTIKQILMDTARDEGTPGEDNDYGMGFVDAYAAVGIAIQGTGALEGNIVNATNGGTPLEGAYVILRGSAARFPSDNAGDYRGRVLPGTYMAVAKHHFFAPESIEVTITEDQTTVQDFSLRDVTGPIITEVSDPRTIPDPNGPYPISATITDPSAIQVADIVYRVNGGVWQHAGMTASGDNFDGEIPGAPAGSTIDFYIFAEDVGGNVSVFPEEAPGAYRSFFVTLPTFVDDAEMDRGWTIGWAGDTATQGIWVRDDPVGTMQGAQPAQPEDDHTADPGHVCFVTANGVPGGPVNAADVDGGCTSLVSPALDLRDAVSVFVYYWRWFGQFGLTGDSFTVQATTNNGLTWVDLETLTSRRNSWVETALRLEDYIPLTSDVRLRFRVCDQGMDSVIEGAVDDVSIEVLPQPPVAVPDAVDTRTSLSATPNPARDGVVLKFNMASPADVSLAIFDSSGRLVRQLLDGRRHAGRHAITWDRRDASGKELRSGVYFYRLRAGVTEESRRIVVVD